jgi:hypothetical protein
VYEGQEEKFGHDGSFFSRALKAPTKADLPDYKTREAMCADADARFQARRADRPGVVWLNRPAAEVLRQMLGDDELAFSGVHLDLEDRPVVEHIERVRDRLPIHEAAARAGIESLISALQTGFSRDGDVVAVVVREMRGTRRLDQAVQTLRHERWHRVMESLKIDSKAFANDPRVRAGRDHLAGSSEYLKSGRLPKWSEIPAYIAARQWERLGYDLDQAVAVFQKYLDLLAQEHGPENVDKALELAHHRIRSEVHGRFSGQAQSASLPSADRRGTQPSRAAALGEGLPGGWPGTPESGDGDEGSESG